MEENHTQQTRTAPLSIDQWKFSTKLIPNYSKFPVQQFKRMLCRAILHYHQQIHQYLTYPKLSSFIQQYAPLLCTIFQLEMEKEYWEYAMNGLLSPFQWLLRTSKDLNKRNSVNWNYPRTEYNIRYRQQLTECKLQQAKRELQLHLQKYPFCWSMSKKTSMNQIISHALMIMIQNGQEKLHTRFEEQKILMQFDVHDIYLIKSLYDLNPTEEQTNSVDNEHATIQDDNSSMFKGNHRLYIDYDYERDQVSFLESLNPVMRTIIETRLANIEQRTQQIIAFLNFSSSSSSQRQ